MAAQWTGCDWGGCGLLPIWLMLHRCTNDVLGGFNYTLQSVPVLGRAQAMPFWCMQSEFLNSTISSLFCFFNVEQQIFVCAPHHKTVDCCSVLFFCNPAYDDGVVGIPYNRALSMSEIAIFSSSSPFFFNKYTSCKHNNTGKAILILLIYCNYAVQSNDAFKKKRTTSKYVS